MASSFDHCGICNSRHVSKHAVVWCPDCDEGLCQNCTEHHSLSKSSRNHKTVPIDEYNKLPPFIANIKLYCDEHDEKYQLFCKGHNAMLCRKCVISEKHLECKFIFLIEEVIQNAKTSVAFTEIESSLQEMKENLKLILKDRQKNVSSLLNSKQRLKSEITTIRHKINEHIDKIQDQFIAKLSKAVENSSQQIQSFIASLKKTQKEIDDCIEDVENIKKHATDMQTYIATTLLETKLNKTENDMQSWINGGSLSQTVVSHEINTVLNNINDEITTFGKPVVDVQTCKLSLRRRKEGQAQLMKWNIGPKPSVEQITLELKTKVKMGESNVSGGCILPCGKLVISNYKPSLLMLFTPDGKLEKEITNIMPYIYDVSYVDKETVAVASSIEMNILLVNLKSGKTLKTFYTTSPCLGMTYTTGNFIVCADKGPLHEISLGDNKTNDIGSSISSSYVACIGNKLFSRKTGTDTIVCHNREGEMLWTFTNKTALEEPRCIAVDEFGNVFVAGKKSNNVVAISSDGREHKILLSKKDMVVKPWAIDYNINLKSLLVANETDGQLFVYNVNYA